MDFRYIAIEGPVGLGKSLLADRLGARLDATIVLDETENPFLGDFYAGRAGAGFQAQLFYTLSRHRQQTQLRQSDLFSQLTVCDYLFERDKIYAYLNLDDNELFIYQRLYELLAQDIPAPDLVIFLQTPTDLLRRRLREREKADGEFPHLDDEYLRELNEAYNHFFFHYNATPLLVVETSQFDLSWGDEAVADMERQVRSMGKGTRYYVPGPEVSSFLMAWFKKDKKPIEPPADKSRVPEGLWVKCPSCSEIIYNKDLAASLNVCTKCAHHFRLGAAERLKTLFDGAWEEYNQGLTSIDPLSFTDTRPYRTRLESSISATGLQDAVITATGTIDGLRCSVAAMEYGFIGGSMGVVVGEKITRAIERAITGRIPVIIVSCSGGARMMEGALSLMQMAKISAALARLDRARLPYISILTDPTTGGVTASFAMLGDVNIAEPKALIGFAGPRVIEQTIRQQLPEGFQRSEFLLEHGMLDAIVDRREMKDMVARFLRFGGPEATRDVPIDLAVAKRVERPGEEPAT